MARQSVYQCLQDFDYLNKLSIVFNSEDEGQHVVTKVAVLRIISQLLRLKKELADNVTENVIIHGQMLTTINSAAFVSKDGIIQACSL